MKKQKESFRNVVPFCGVLLCMGVGLAIVANTYQPGESIKRNERKAVDALYDSTLNARLVTYYDLHRDLRGAKDRGTVAMHTPKKLRPLHPHFHARIKRVYPEIDKNTPLTLITYKEHLDAYARDSVETRYQYLRDMINKQNTRQK